MRMSDLIVKKRDGQALTTEEIRYVVDGYTRGVSAPAVGDARLALRRERKQHAHRHRDDRTEREHDP